MNSFENIKINKKEIKKMFNNGLNFLMYIFVILYDKEHELLP